MRILTALAGGLIGGLAGMAIWAGISYATNYEIGWIAWGVGFLVGLGVRIGSQEWDGAGPGALAVLLALLSVVGGKYAAATLAVSDFDKDQLINVTATDIIESLANEIVEERMKNGPPLKWSPGKTADDASALTDFPADVQQAATKRWAELTPAEQQQKIDAEKKQREELRVMIKGVVHRMAFQNSFGVMDIIFFLLAAVTAFRLGSGSESDD